MSNTKYVSQIDYIGPHQIAITGGQSKNISITIEHDKLKAVTFDCSHKPSLSSTKDYPKRECL